MDNRQKVIHLIDALQSMGFGEPAFIAGAALAAIEQQTPELCDALCKAAIANAQTAAVNIALKLKKA